MVPISQFNFEPAVADTIISVSQPASLTKDSRDDG